MYCEIERIVDVLGPLGLAGRARGVVQDRRRFRFGGQDRKAFDPRFLFHVQGDLFFAQGFAFVVVNDDDVAQGRQVLEQDAHLGHVLFLGEDGGRAGIGQAREQGFSAECREQWLGDAAHFQDGQKTEIQLGHLVHEQADALARLQAQVLQILGDGIGQQAHVVEGVLFYFAGVAFPDQGQLVALALAADAVAAVFTDVDVIARLVFELFFRNGPVEILDLFFVTAHVGHVRPPIDLVYRDLDNCKMIL